MFSCHFQNLAARNILPYGSSDLPEAVSLFRRHPPWFIVQFSNNRVTVQKQLVLFHNRAAK